MTIAKGDRLPKAELLRMGAEGPEAVDLGPLLQGKRVVIFAVPGAYTPTCHSAHMPSFVQNAGKFAEKGVDLICVTVNDPFVTAAWARETGAEAAGITVLSDAGGGFTQALGLDFTAPPAGLYGRSLRYAMRVEDGVVQELHVEDNPGACSVSAGPAMLDSL